MTGAKKVWGSFITARQWNDYLNDNIEEFIPWEYDPAAKDGNVFTVKGTRPPFSKLAIGDRGAVLKMGGSAPEWVNLAKPDETEKAKCAYCGQWGEARSECMKCGAPIDEFTKYPVMCLEPISEHDAEQAGDTKIIRVPLGGGKMMVMTDILHRSDFGYPVTTHNTEIVDI